VLGKSQAANIKLAALVTSRVTLVARCVSGHGVASHLISLTLASLL
jgi:hypothetical protein